MRTIVLFTVVLFMSSCTINKITERRTKRNLNLVHDASVEILELQIKRFEVDTLKDRSLKRKLKHLNVEKVEIYVLPNSDFDADSVIVFSRYQFFLAEGQIIFDFRKLRRTELKPKWGAKLIKIDDRVYFRKNPIPIS